MTEKLVDPDPGIAGLRDMACLIQNVITMYTQNIYTRDNLLGTQNV